MLSTLAFSPTNSGMLAVGSYGQSTGIYREDNMELLYVLHGQEGGVTHVSHLLFAFVFVHLEMVNHKIKLLTCFQVQFSKDGNYLYTGGRKVNY